MTGGIIQTERLVLRPLVANDAAAITAALNVFDVAKWLSAPPYPYTLADAEYYISDIAPSETNWAIDDGTGLIGLIGCKPDLGYWLDQRHHGRGLMTEAARAVVDWYFNNETADLISGHFVGNIGSRTVLLRLGFSDTHMESVTPPATGEVVDLQRMKLTYKQWVIGGPLSSGGAAHG